MVAAPRNNLTLGVTLIATAVLIGIVLVIGQRTSPNAPTPPTPEEVLEQVQGELQPVPAPVEPDPVEITLGTPALPAAEPEMADAPALPMGFIEAAETGTLDRLLELLEAGADPNAPTPDGITPLMRAARGGHLEAVFVLLDMGANPAAKDTEGKTASDHAQQYPQIVRVLEGATPPEIRPDPSK